MHTIEIPRDDWDSFFNQFSKDHQGQKVTVELLGSDVGDQLAARDVPLLGISTDTGLSIGSAIEVMVGDSLENNLIRVVHKPANVLLSKGDDGSDRALQIDSLDGSSTLVRFGSETAPDAFVGY